MTRGDRMAMRRFVTFVPALVLMFCGSLPVLAAFECIDYIDVDVPESIDAVQWLPCREGYENDDLWEVQCTHEEDGTTLAQRFTESAEDTGNTNYLDTVYNADNNPSVSACGEATSL